MIESASKLDGVRPKLLRVYALIDAGKPADAMKLAQEIVRLAPEPTGTPCEADNKRANLEARTLCELGRMLSSEGKERLKASESLSSLASASKNQIPRHALGVGFLAFKDAPPIDPNVGSNLEYAKKQLTKAYADISDAFPNPLVYRTLTSLAEVALIEKDLKAAREWLDKAIEANADYRPARAVEAQLALREGNPEKALELATALLAEISSTQILLTKAEALATKKSVTEKDKAEATKILESIKERPQVSIQELARIAALIDPKTPEELGLPGPEDKNPKAPKKRGK